jgi:capsular polysaccharide biosynthesis protein
MTEFESTFRLADLYGVLRRRLIIILVALVIGAVVGYAAVGSRTTKFEGMATIVVQPINTTISVDVAARATSSSTPSSVGDLIASDEIAREVRKELKLTTSASDLLENLTTTNSPGSLTVDITYTADTQRMANRVADTFGEVFLTQRKRVADGLLIVARTRLTAALTPLQAQLSTANTALGLADPATGPGAAARAQADQLSAQVTSLMSQLNALANIDTTPGQLVRRASDTASTAGVPNIALEAGIAAAFALLGVGLALLRDRMDPRIAAAVEASRVSPGTAVDVLPKWRSALAVPLRGSPRAAALDRIAFRLSHNDSPEIIGEGPQCVVIAGTGDKAPIGLGLELHHALVDAGQRSVLVSTVPESDIGREFPDLERRSLGAIVKRGNSLKRFLGKDARNVLLCPDDDADAVSVTDHGAVERLLARAATDEFDLVLFVAPTPIRHPRTIVVARDSHTVVVAAGPRSSRAGVRDALTAFVDADLAPTEIVVS